MSHRDRPVKTVTTNDIARRLNVTMLTILNWRRGSTERRPLPVIYTRRGKSRRIKFLQDDLCEFLGAYRPDLLAAWVQH